MLANRFLQCGLTLGPMVCMKVNTSLPSVSVIFKKSLQFCFPFLFTYGIVDY